LTSSPNDVTTTSGVGVAPLVDATAAVLEGLVDDEVGAHGHLVAIPAL
jgi:hypothetical protein